MQKSPEEMLASCVKAVDARDINAARAACERTVEYVEYLDSGSAGRIYAAAVRAGEALFELLNYASTYGGCREADRAIVEYREYGDD